MSINSLPTAIAAAIQAGFLERQFRDALTAKLGFRDIADREEFTAGIGETVTKTRTGLLAAVTTPIATAAVTDITSGLTNAQYGLEQYTLAVAQYALPMQLNFATAKVAIDSLFLKNAYTLGENAARSVDTLAQRALYDQYMGGNTRVRVTLGAPALTVSVDDVRGFFMTTNSSGQPVPVSVSNTLAVTFTTSAGATATYTLTGVQADGTAPATINPWLSSLSFSGASSNTSTTPGGYSGVLTFSGNVTVASGTLNNAVASAVAPVVFRPSIAATGIMEYTTAAINPANDLNNSKLTMQMVLNAKATMSANGVPPIDASGLYHMYADPLHFTGLYQDPAFQMFFRGQDQSKEYKMGVVSELLGVKLIETNLNPVQALSGVGVVRRAALCGAGALVEAGFTQEAYAGTDAGLANGVGAVTFVDGIAHITRPPIDTLQQVVTQAWSWIGGFVAPTDVTTNPNTIPTANNSALKRAVILESL